MTQKISILFNTFLSMITILCPTFLALSSDALSFLPIASKARHLTYHGISSSSPTSFSAFTANYPRRSFYGDNGNKRTLSSFSTTKLSMYNLPPSGGGSGGGGGGGKTDIADIAKGALSILLTVGFFVSPLGGIVLGIFNSFVVLLFLLPLAATFGFQVWQKFNTVQGPCPNCGEDVTVMKNKDDASVVDNAIPNQSLCFKCGAVLQANESNTGINNVSGRKTIDDLNGPMGGRSSIFDIFSEGVPTESSATTTTVKTTSANKKDNIGKIDMDAIIDVDILDEDKPFQ